VYSASICPGYSEYGGSSEAKDGFLRALEGRTHSGHDVTSTLDGLSTTHADLLKTLMTLNFQQFKDVSPMAA